MKAFVEFPSHKRSASPPARSGPPQASRLTLHTETDNTAAPSVTRIAAVHEPLRDPLALPRLHARDARGAAAHLQLRLMCPSSARASGPRGAPHRCTAMHQFASSRVSRIAEMRQTAAPTRAPLSEWCLHC